MMAKALLISLATDSTSGPDKGRFLFKDLQRRPLLGLLYISSALESRGIKCELLDQSVSDFSIDRLIDRVKENRHIFVGFYSQLVIKDKVNEYIRTLKVACPESTIVVGGPGFLYYKEFLNNGCDIVCRGEGESTIVEIVDHLKGNRRLNEIDGIVYRNRKTGAIFYNKDRTLVKNLDSLPFPAWNSVNLDLYYDYSILPMKRPFAVIITSRGCPFKCSFCSGPYFWNNVYRTRSVENVLKEIDLLVSKHGIRYLLFQDDVFGLDNNWLRDFCLSLINKRYKDLHWMCILHPLALKQDPCGLIGLMKKAGCDLFVFGLQSANTSILEKICRHPCEPETLKGIIKIANKLGIMSSVDFILGLPGENKDTIRENMDFVLKARPYLVNFHALRLEPASKLSETYKDKKICKFSGNELIRLCQMANQKFYLRPQNAIRILAFILKKNPALFFKTARFCNHKMLSELS